MVELHKPVSDHHPPTPIEPVSGTPEWQEKFWKKLAENNEPSCSTSTAAMLRESGTRPKTSRQNSARVTLPSDPEDELRLKSLYEKPYEMPKWLLNKMKREGKSYPKTDYICTALPGDKVQIQRNGAISMPFDIVTNEDGDLRLQWSEMHNIWFALEKLNLKDPKIVKQVCKACSSKPDNKEEDISKDKSNKKSVKKTGKK